MKKKRTITKNRSSYKKSKRKNSRKKTNKKSRTRTLKKKELLKIITSLTSQKKKRSKKKKSRKKRTKRKGKRGGFLGPGIAAAQHQDAQARARAPAPEPELTVPAPAPEPEPEPEPVPEPAVAEPEPEPEQRWVVQHQPRVAIRAAPSTSAEIIGVAKKGAIVTSLGPPQENWIQLAPASRPGGAAAAWMMVDGASVGLGVLLRRRITVPGSQWAPAPEPEPAVADTNDTRLAYEKEWVDLSDEEKAQAEELEFSDDSWPTQPPNWVEWGTLENDKQLAAEGLGFTEELWKGLQFKVGETVERKNVGSPWSDGVVTNIIPLRVTISPQGEGEAYTWFDVKKKESTQLVTTHHEQPLQPIVARRGRCDVCNGKVAAGEQIMGTEDHGFYMCANCVLEETEAEADVASRGSSRTPIESNKPREETTKWGKFTSLLKGKDYEKFIKQSGQGLKELYLNYLEEYFQDIEKEENVDLLKENYINFINEYYEKAIEKDKQLLKILKNN